MSNLRLCVILVLIFATSWIYFFNVRFVALKLLVFVRNLENEDTEWWRHFGLETECKIFMKQDPHGATLDDFQAYRSNLLIRRHHSSVDLKVGTDQNCVFAFLPKPINADILFTLTFGN